jgi:hypothetical protein
MGGRRRRRGWGDFLRPSGASASRLEIHGLAPVAIRLARLAGPDVAAEAAPTAGEVRVGKKHWRTSRQWHGFTLH